MKSALITGVTGQDGSYLAELLLRKNYQVIGLKRRTSTNNLNRLTKCINHKNLFIIDGSSIPKNPLKFPTGLIMANAYRIGNKF